MRITYTSPKTMHWITYALNSILENESCDLLNKLEKYCKTKVEASKFEEASGFDFERIVFTYLDYLLYKYGYTYKNRKLIKPMMDKWEFKFRNSIEHFYPRNPAEGEKWDFYDLNGFGNLALITVSGNSRFSNMLPTGKIGYKSIMAQSLKLIIMGELVTLDGKGWTVEKAKEHEEEMFNILRQNIRQS